ncbi:MAG TPA: dihydropteroate synthase [Gammaproteobacteria bacterium]|nr:dihydropteroate synthase [Gammaproteobacteria bacterium]
MTIDCAGRLLLLDRPVVMGVLNVTPDSFSDGGLHSTPNAAVERGLEMVEEGAALIDVGGESTRPGAAEVSVDEELERVLPVIEKLVTNTEVPVSIDTRHPEVMRAAIEAGAGMVNDVNALRSCGAIDAVAGSRVALCLMHMHADPRTMQENPSYGDVVAEVATFFHERIDACASAGIDKERLLIDPGFGFGKRLEHNLALLVNLQKFQRFGVPILIGVSRKSMIGELTGRAVEQRLSGSLAAALIAVERGAKIVRAHDVAATVDALKVAAAVSQLEQTVLERK